MLKVVVIGAGVMGSLHARIYSRLPEVKLVAVCDIDKTKGQALSKIYNTNFYSNYNDLINKEDFDAVSISTPTNSHKDLAIACIENGKHVLVEKPLAQSVIGAKAIVESANKNGVLLTVGHIERFNPAVLKLKQFIDKGTFGAIVSIVVKRVGLYPPRIKDVNVITDLAVHDLDIVCNLLGQSPKSLVASGGSGINRDQIDYADILLNFGKTSCYLQVNWITPIKIRTISVTGTLSYGELDYITQELNLYKSHLATTFPQEFEKFVTKLGKAEKIPVKIRKEEPLKLELINFIESISNKQNPTVTGKQGLLAIKLSEAILKSLRQRKLITFTK